MVAFLFETCFLFKFIVGYFKSLGGDYVLDTKVADDLALLESRAEFVERFRSESPVFPLISSSCPGICIFFLVVAH
jgi:iron only hydrogenase large subunit-like protein